jgi:hypothetical protein
MTEARAVKHGLRCDHAEFDAIAADQKTFEVRLDDRHYKIGDVLELIRLSKTEAKQLERYDEFGASPLNPPAVEQYELLQAARRMQCVVVWKVRLTGAVVPGEPHWWKPVEAMQHGIAVMGIRRERPSRDAARARHFAALERSKHGAE